MNPTLLVRIRPTTPWRIGPDTGSHEQAGAVLHSDALYSAVCSAMGQMGLLEEWLNATASPYGEPAARFSSAFPFQRHLLFVPPPAGLWPPPPPTGAPARLRWKGASLAPFEVVTKLLAGEALSEDDWVVDPESGCLLPSVSRAATGPFRLMRRSFATVDRPTGGCAEPWSTTCVQFAPGAGLWAAVQFSSQQTYAVWAPKIQAALRILSDSGIGGLRSRGFGRFRLPEFQAGTMQELFPASAERESGGGAWWLLSLFSPGHVDEVQWDAGRYSLVARSGRAVSGALKLTSRLVREGSVLVSGAALRGSVQNVAGEGSAHPVLRAGFAVAIPIPWQVPS